MKHIMLLSAKAQKLILMNGNVPLKSRLTEKLRYRLSSPYIMLKIILNEMFLHRKRADQVHPFWPQHKDIQSPSAQYNHHCLKTAILCLFYAKRVRYADIDLYNRRLRADSIMTGSAGIKSSYNYYSVIKNIERIATENNNKHFSSGHNSVIFCFAIITRIVICFNTKLMKCFCTEKELTGV